MRCIGIEPGNNPIVIVEDKFLWMRKVTRYQSSGKIAGDFHNWVKLPDRTLVPTSMSFQLDEWLKSA